MLKLNLITSIEKMIFLKRIVFIIFFFAIAQNINAHEGHDHGQPLAVSLALDGQHHLLRVSVQNGFVIFDKAKNTVPLEFNSKLRINHQAQKIGTDGDARPKIAVANNGNIYITWTQHLPSPYTGYIWFARSTDGGKSFSKPIIVHHDQAEITHRFDAITVTASGRIYVAWVDKRDLIVAKKSGQAYDGAAIYYAVSDDHGLSFSHERKVADNSCECCRIAMIVDDQGNAVMMWRHLFEQGVRDHAIASINPEQDSYQIHRASFANWKIDACPHHGPAIAKGGDWGYHMAWFDGGENTGLFYARMDGNAWVSSPAKRFGDASKQAGHPALLSNGEDVWLAWKERSDNASQIKLAKSNDGGRSWSDPITLAQTNDKSDYPQLLIKDSQVYLAWNTQADGLVWIKVGQ
jgi:hypothetical protein